MVGRNTSLLLIPKTSYISTSAGNLPVSLYILRDSWTSNRISELHFNDANVCFIQMQAVQHKFYLLTRIFLCFKNIFLLGWS